MTGSHLPETFPEPASLDESDGDQFSDELYRSRAEADGLLVKMDFATVKSLKPDCVCLQILDFRYTTLKAVFTWMLTGSIHFAPVDCFDKYSFDRDRYDLLPASPRAVYHLAHYFGLESLKREAREYLLSQLTRGEAKHELKRFLALNYEEVKVMSCFFRRAF